MFKWYKDCGRCYIYLVDVSTHGTKELRRAKFEQSSWFTRAWTLQELLAPRKRFFYFLQQRLDVHLLAGLQAISLGWWMGRPS
jgi:hypothetical protein